MACRCSPCLVGLRAELDRQFPGRHANLGCCGDQAHAARKSDHNADESGYAHALDIGEGTDHGLQWFVDRMMANPAAYPQVKYLIYERSIYYPNHGARPAGRYAYTGPNAHATHLHISIHSPSTFDRRPWLDAVSPLAASKYQEEEVRPFVLNAGGPNWLVVATGQGLVKFLMTDANDVRVAPDGYGPPVEVDVKDLDAIPRISI